jgi:hypothetical protein
MKKLGREIRVKFIYTDELLKKLYDYQDESWYQKMKEEFAVKEIIKFNPFYGDSYDEDKSLSVEGLTVFPVKVIKKIERIK